MEIKLNCFCGELLNGYNYKVITWARIYMHNKRLKYVNSKMKYAKKCKIKILDMLFILLSLIYI